MRKAEFSPWGRFLALKKTTGIRGRIFCYFLFFTGLLLVLLWLFQVVFLDDFYRFQKTEMLKSSSQSIVDNIGNENLQTLVDRIAEQNEVCVLVADESMDALVTSDTSPGCIIHHMNRRDLKRYAERLGEGEETILRSFPMMGFRNRLYDAGKFKGHVPPSDDGNARSMVTAQRAIRADGSVITVFLNALTTPVTATVQTIRNELFFITIILVLLSFLLSLVLSRRITRPLIETTEAARALSTGEFTPVVGAGSYREIDQLNRQLVQAAKDLHRVEEMQRELIANISHDLRTPLTLIEGYAEVMRDLPGESTSENMQIIIDETKRLTTLVNAVLDYSNAKSGQGASEARPFDLTQSIRDIIARYVKLIEQDGYRVIFEPMQTAYVLADELKVGQVVYNLINNALTYTGADKTVAVGQTIAEDIVRIDVIDTGEGIAESELAQIWSRYYRGHKPHKPHKPHKRAAVGTGLGLNIVQGILDSYGVDYGVNSEIGKGSVFWFTLPIAHGNECSLPLPNGSHHDGEQHQPR